mgnify:CR=1 FL=1
MVSSIGNAQNPNYNSLWDKVKNYELEGLPKSALNVVEEISELAKKDKNTSRKGAKKNICGLAPLRENGNDKFQGMN